MKVIGLAGLAFITLIYLLTRSGGQHGPYSERAPSGNPPVVLVTVFDESKHTPSYVQMIKDNRRLYAEKHGYQTFFAKIGDYDLHGSPFSWTNVVAVRHAITKFPDCKYIWYLDQHSFIMNPVLAVEEHIMKPSRLESLMIKDHPVVPPDSIIKTFSHLKGQDVDFVLTQDHEGLSPGSFILRNGDWARFLLETWYDPLYRSYNFQKAETHALEHLVQWHPTVLARLALVHQRIMNAYSKDDKDGQYQPGDMVIRFKECLTAITRECDEEARQYTQQWRTAFMDS